MEVVSLGPNCHTTTILRLLNYRKCAYTFDWILTNIKIINNCIQNNCVDFVDRSNYTISKNHLPHLTLKSQQINYLDPMFIHKNPIENENDYLYTLRCVERFNNLQNTHKSILFVHTVYDTDLNLLLSSEDINELQNTLNAKYAQYHLLIINWVDTIFTNHLPNTYDYKFIDSNVGDVEGCPDGDDVDEVSLSSAKGVKEGLTLGSNNKLIVLNIYIDVCDETVKYTNEYWMYKERSIYRFCSLFNPIEEIIEKITQLSNSPA